MFWLTNCQKQFQKRFSNINLDRSECNLSQTYILMYLCTYTRHKKPVTDAQLCFGVFHL